MPDSMRSNSSWPYSVRVDAWVATAPTPLRTHGTPLPTQGLRVVTATPDSPVSGSTAAIEKVVNSMSGPAPHAAGSCARAADGVSTTSSAAPKPKNRPDRDIPCLRGHPRVEHEPREPKSG